jgi:hypothetical protein
MKRGGPGGKFLVSGGDQRAAIVGEVGIGDTIGGKELFDGGAFVESGRVFRLADDFFQAAEKEDLYVDGT